MNTYDFNSEDQFLNIFQNIDNWEAPNISDPSSITKGDMPGDVIKIDETHIQKAQVIFRRLLKLLQAQNLYGTDSKIVVSVHGGSGVGKSEIGSLLAHYLKGIRIGTYVLSGDNYPHRIPRENDKERLRIFRKFGLKGLVASKQYNKEVGEQLKELVDKNVDFDPSLVLQFPWLSLYQEAGKVGLADYLGSLNEIDFDELNKIIQKFKSKESAIFLKRMGREDNEVWYDSVDFSHVKVLIIEWTHGNNDHLVDVDIPILLNSTPEETLAHRKSRNRDGAIDSPFTTMVLTIEQELLASQASKAKIIVQKNGDML